MGKVVVCETLLKPQEIPVPSHSAGDGTFYNVISRTLFNDSVCDCKGFLFRGSCKHIGLVEKGICNFYRPPTDEDTADNLGRCPVCHNVLVLYELEPEFG